MSFANLRAAAGHRFCRNLRCKEMYYTDEELLARTREKLKSAPETAYEGRYFWCLKTFTAAGPDQSPCGAAECPPTRDCYEA